jgi:hypothetical protein
LPLTVVKSRDKLKDSFEEKEIEWVSTVAQDIEKLVGKAFDLDDALVELRPSTGTPPSPARPR